MTIAPSTLPDLQKALKDRVAAVLAPFWGAETKSGGHRVPNVVDGWIPPKATADTERFPFAEVRPLNGIDSKQAGDQDAKAAWLIVLGVYGDTDDGWIPLLQMIQALRESLDEAPLLDGTAFEHEGPLEWALTDPQPRPQWFAVVTTNWLLPRPRRESPEV